MDNNEFENMNENVNENITENLSGNENADMAQRSSNTETGLEAIFSSQTSMPRQNPQTDSAQQINENSQMNNPMPQKAFQNHYYQPSENVQQNHQQAQQNSVNNNYYNPYSSTVNEYAANNQNNPYTRPDAYQQQYQPYNRYTDAYNYQNGYYDSQTQQNRPAKNKTRSRSGSKAAYTVGILAIALFVGLSGGIAGSYVMNKISDSSTVETSESSSSNKSESSAGSSSDNNKKADNSSALVINQASQTETAPTTTQEVAAKVKDSVVEITTETTSYDSFYGQYVSQAAGSGVIISADGYLLTNNHVIENANTITVRLTNGKTYDASLIGKDATLDIALLKINEKDLTTATFGDSSKLSVGQTAIAIGNPLGRLGGTVTDGIISALDREIEIDGKTMNLLQTNAAINPGNSGGGLFDSNGNLIGIVVAKSSSSSSGTSVEGLGFAIPINDVSNILDELKQNGYVSDRAYLGINLQDITSQNEMFYYRVDKAGAYVSAVAEGSAAQKAGLQIYDCITKIDDKEISQSSEVSAIISKHKKGDKIKITVYRDGKTVELDVTLDARPNSDSDSDNNNNSRRRIGLDGIN